MKNPQTVTALHLSQEDVVSPRCQAIGCATHPSFAFPGERPRRCKAHLLEGMVRCIPHPGSVARHPHTWLSSSGGRDEHHVSEAAGSGRLCAQRAPRCLFRRCTAHMSEQAGALLELSPSGWLLASRPQPEPGAPGRKAWVAATRAGVTATVLRLRLSWGSLRSAQRPRAEARAGDDAECPQARRARRRRTALAGRLRPQPHCLSRAGATLACLAGGSAGAPPCRTGAPLAHWHAASPSWPLPRGLRAQPLFLHCRAPAPHPALMSLHEGLARRMLCARSTPAAHGAMRVPEGSCKCA